MDYDGDFDGALTAVRGNIKGVRCFSQGSEGRMDFERNYQTTGHLTNKNILS